MTRMQDAPPLSDYTATKLSHTYRKPAEWIGSLTGNRRIYILAGPRALMVAISDSLGEALRTIKNGDGQKIRHSEYDAEVSTDAMLRTTGLKLACEVVENLQGETR